MRDGIQDDVLFRNYLLLALEYRLCNMLTFLKISGGLFGRDHTQLKQMLPPPGTPTNLEHLFY